MAIKVNGTTVVDDSRNLTNVASATLTGTLTLNTTGAMVIPTGTTAQQPATPFVGMMRYNTTNDSVEIYKASGIWTTVGESKGRLFFFGSLGG